MKDRNVNSYNLSYARQLLDAMAPTRKPASKIDQPTDTRPYVRLMPVQKPGNGEQATRPTETVSAEKTRPAFTEPSENFPDWESCIAWCIGITSAEAAFVVDSQGFIIATRGRIPSHGFECTGAELVFTMDQLERIDPEAGKLLWIDLDFNQRRLVGFITPVQNNEYFIVGLVAPDPAYNILKPSISKHIVKSLPSMN
ncbi:hypothetical protein [Syntrophotalea acetylenica]|jgi:hypothetical protein|uniref:hypothetical protein n=1 Tax=Syntrophotalea TaxID=2812025 RepID=UPI002A36DC72|nr:hypothetical protein [Syntrophotalea acetylenica]MDY0260887.1 hypothetical protein [Syntrophotalea acetylenica]